MGQGNLPSYLPLDIALHLMQILMSDLCCNLNQTYTVSNQILPFMIFMFNTLFLILILLRSCIHSKQECSQPCRILTHSSPPTPSTIGRSTAMNTSINPSGKGRNFSLGLMHQLILLPTKIWIRAISYSVLTDRQTKLIYSFLMSIL